MESEYESDYSVERLYRQEFELLKDMFEAHFSPEVIAGVLEDCDGDVNLAVDTLTKIEGNTDKENPQITEPTMETSETENSPPSNDTECPSSNVSNNGNTCLPTQSYAAASQVPVDATRVTTLASNKPPRSRNVMPKVDYWTDQMKKIITDYNEGSRLLIIMRGPPGCGKTYLARVIVESTVGTANSNNHANYIFSADDHMKVSGRYHYDVRRLQEVHMKNQKCVYKAVYEGRSPVIVDNTNMTIWEMMPYVTDAVKNGYIVEIVEPKTPWSNSPWQLAKRNRHGVPKEKIETMLQRYEGTMTGKQVIKYCNLQYPEDKKPPVQRNIPPFINRNSIDLNPIVNLNSDQGNLNSDLNSDRSIRSSLRVTENESTNNFDNPTSSVNLNFNVDETSPEKKQQETEKNLDEMQKVEVEWDNGIAWEATSSSHEPETATVTSSEPKPQRSKSNSPEDTFIDKSILHDDWTKYFMYVSPWQGDTVSTVQDKEIKEIPVTTKTTSTLVERDDFCNENFNIKIGVPRNINEVPNPDKIEPKIPKQRMLDRSTSTHTTLSSGRCEHEEKHFVSMKKLFKNISRPVLREIFDKCAGDVHWACTIVIDDIQKNNLKTLNIEETDSDEEDEVECQCLARYNIIPDKATESVLSLEEKLPPDSSSTAITLSKKKTKKDKVLTEETFILKRQIEKTFTIPDNHYTEHYLNLHRSQRRDISPNSEKAPIASQHDGSAIDPNEGNASLDPELSNQNKSTKDERTTITQRPLLNCINIMDWCPNTPDLNINKRTLNTFNIEQDAKPYLEISSPKHHQISFPSPELTGYLQNSRHQDIPSTSSTHNDDRPCTSTNSEPIVDIDDDDSESDDYGFVTNENQSVTVNLGMEFIRKLDASYGRLNFEYPEGVQPILSIPTDIMLKLNALWIESISDQLDNNIPKQMTQQDEEFARKLQRELELDAIRDSSNNSPETAEQKEPESTSFKEIMDVDLALAICEKQVKQMWKSKEPQDMAAQMTRNKLFELFPDMNKDVLSELLIAHNNNFGTTVEILLISTGQDHYLEHPNAINRFVMEKTKENKAKLLISEEKVINDQNDGSHLLDPGLGQGEVTLDTVNGLRQAAEKFRIARDLYRSKAAAYLNRGDFDAASQYSAIASLHTYNYDSSNHHAAAALVHYHANAHPDVNVIDLHYLRVQEAENTLDLFIDERLRRLRQSPIVKSVTIHIITGRGKHSPSGPRIRPAVMRRLTARGLKYRQQNPGLLEARLKHTHLLTDELLNP